MPATLRFRRSPALAALGLLFAGPLAAQAPLSKDSPFMPAGAPAVITATGEVYEFAAVSTIDKKTLVNIYDKQGKKGRWIAVGETLDGISVKNYDGSRDQVVVTIGGAEKILTLRKSSGTINTPVTVPGIPQATFSVAPPAAAPAGGPAHVATLANPVFVAPVPVGPTPAVAVTQPPPPVPGSIAHQEQEARMLVSDLLEIGMVQRKAYEEKQKAAAAAQSGNPPASAPAPTPPAGK